MTKKDLKKYFKIKLNNPKLKSHWYDISCFNTEMLRLIHTKQIIKLVKEYFNTNVVFSGRPAIHVHDFENDFLLEAHQKLNNSQEIFLFWAPLWDTNKRMGVNSL